MIPTTKPPGPAPAGTDTDDYIPGDDYGLYETRAMFTRPVSRDVGADKDEALEGVSDVDAPPEETVSPGLATALARRLGITERQAGTALLLARHDMNEALRVIEQRGWVTELPPHSYGLVALEQYEPETFCLVSFAVPRYEMLRDPDLLDAIHELTLSAAEMPVDSTPEELCERFVREWTIESGERVSEILGRVEHGGLQVKGVCVLPWGEFSAHGYHVLHPVSQDYPNIGTAACAAALDLRSGIAERFRFVAERIPDSVCEHVVREHYSYGQQVHLLKQPYLWTPEYSVEDMLRYKESLLQPSAVMQQLRYAFCNHHMDDQRTYARDAPVGPARKSSAFRARPNPYRNVVELYELKTKQHEMGKHYKENATPSHVFSHQGTPIIYASCGGGGGGYAGEQSYEKFTDVTNIEQAALGTTGAVSASERLWRRFYSDNLF